MGILFNPYALGAIGLALLLSHGWAFNQGRHLEQWKQAAAITAANKRVAAINNSETERDSKEEATRDKALTDAKSVLERNKFLASPELAEVLSRIK